MSRSLSFEFEATCGFSYEAGDVVFTPDNQALLSPVGTRLNKFYLAGNAESSCTTYPFEALSSIRRASASKHFLVIVAEDNRGLIGNLDTGAILHRFTVKGQGRVSGIQISHDERYIAIAVGRKVQLWGCPDLLNRTFASMIFIHEYSVHADEITCLKWTDFGFLTGGKDCVAHITPVEFSGKQASLNPSHASVSLIGHRSPLKGVHYLQDSDAPAVFTVSEDGAVFEWRFTQLRDHQGKAKAKRKKSFHQDEETQAKEYQLENRHFIQTGQQSITCCAFMNALMVVGFSDGVFSVIELPSCEKLQTLSASKFAIEACAISNDGSWLALGSPTAGQLIVWEWLSETFVLRQQGHFSSISCTAFSPDGRTFCTGGEDHKLKVWSSSTNVCFVTFTEHSGPITACAFPSNSVVISCSLDGTCRAFDLLRMRNFRILSTPQPCQLISLATDGEVVCCGSMEPYQIFLWSLRTGKLLEVLNGHTGPVSDLKFAPNKPLLASSSWDGSIKLWEPFSMSVPVETFVQAFTSNQLAVAFRPDGKELCTTGLDGILSFWLVESGTLRTTINCRRDLGAKEKLDKFFTTVTYSPDGQFVLAAGKSEWVFAYDCEREILLKKYQLSFQRESRLADEQGEEDADDSRKRRWSESKYLPGVQSKKRDLGKRLVVQPFLQVNRIEFSPSGRKWAAATNSGLLLFSLDFSTSFDPVDLDINCTLQSTRLAALRGEYPKACVQSLFLGIDELIDEVFASVPLNNIPLVVKIIPKTHLETFVRAVSRGLENDLYLQHYLLWGLSFFRTMSEADQTRFRNMLLPSLRNFQRSILKQEKLLSKLCDENMYDLAV